MVFRGFLRFFAAVLVFVFGQGALGESDGFVVGRARHVSFRYGTVAGRPARSASAPYQTYQNESRQAF